MIDFHSHILPDMDDGAKNVDESVLMLKESFRQGVKDIAATPHFYAEENSPRDFLKRREESYSRLLPNLQSDMPRVRLGAEVKYFEGISRNDDIELLKLSGTDVLLVEMPFMPWTSRVISDVCELSMRPRTTVVLAHFERYFKFGAKKYLTALEGCGILIQANAESFVKSSEKQKLMKLLKSGKVHLLGSDCHNTESRPTKMLEAKESICKRLGEDALMNVNRISKALMRIE